MNKLRKKILVIATIPLGVVLLCPLFLLGLTKLFELDDRWRKEEFSSLFQKETRTFDELQEFILDTIRYNEKTITIYGFKEKKPILLLSLDDGKTWKMTNTSLNENILFSDDSDKWNYWGMGMIEGKIGEIYVNKLDSFLKSPNFLLEKRKKYYLNNLCSTDAVYAQKEKNWIVCGYDEYASSTYEVRILHRNRDGFHIFSTIPYKRHIWLSDALNPSDFYVKDSLMAGIFKFRVGAGRWFHYLYYSIDAGKTWRNEKIPAFEKERLAVIKNNIIVLGVNYSYNEKKGKVTILTMPIPKK